MTEINLKLISLLEEGKSLEEIKSIMHLSSKQILRRLNDLKMLGLDYLRNYHYDGNISFNINKGFEKNNKSNVSICDFEENCFKAIIVSDLHIGSPLERLDLLDKMYEYAIKNNINIIINAGDLIEGANNFPNVERDVYLKQIDHLLKVYPYDKSIINFVTLGNHDVDSLRKDGIDLGRMLLNNRFDIVPLGVGKGILKVKNDYIHVVHPVSGIDINSDSPHLVLRGHSHKLKTVYENNYFTFYIPSLSDIKQVGSPWFPCFLELNVVFSNKLFKRGYLTTLMVNNNHINRFNTIQIDFTYNEYNYKKIKK